MSKPVALGTNGLKGGCLIMRCHFPAPASSLGRKLQWWGPESLSKEVFGANAFLQAHLET